MNSDFHRLLKRQVRKFFPEGLSHPELEAFLEAVNQSYNHFEADRKMMERAMELSSEELMVKNQELQQKNETLDSFIYRISHDLKNPANNIRSMVDMLSEQLFVEQQPELIRKILDHLGNASNSMVNRIMELLEMSRVDNQMNALEEEIHLDGLVDEVLESISSQVQESGATIETDFSTCPTVVFGRENLRSIFSNLISNAIKYRSPSRAPFVSVGSRAEGQNFFISVSDNGLGINLERDGDRLFGMFNRMHNHVEGSGVGLYIVKRIVENKSGDITVSSKIDQGTTFNIKLPHEKSASKAEVHSVGR